MVTIQLASTNGMPGMYLKLQCERSSKVITPTNEVWNKVMFLHLSLCSRGGGWLPSIYHRSHDHVGLHPGEVLLLSMHHRSHDQGGLHLGQGLSPGESASGGLGTMGYSQQVGGTHRTRMHSCCNHIVS